LTESLALARYSQRMPSELVWVVPFAKYAHVATMFAAATIQVGADLYFLKVAEDGDAQTTARLGHAVRRRGPITGPILEIGIAFGVITALIGGFNLLAPWLLASYIVIALGTVSVFRWAAPAFTALLEAADAGDDARIAALLAQGPYRPAALANAAMYAVVIFLMVVKPLS
jgi:hypothetical protein